MKKFLVVLALLISLLLGLLYLAVNSPYVVERIARKYAPKYHFRYEAIRGNPLKGITLDGLYYKGEKLAQRIRLRINSYALLQRRIAVSLLELEGVDVDVLEPMLRDFVAPTLEEAAPAEESGPVIPFAFALQNIRLSLLPFERYGVKVSKEELAIDSIYYDTDRFNVGDLKQVAETSLGRVELEGIYHRRFLDVKLLAVDDLDLKGVERLIARIGGLDEAQPSAAGKAATESNTSQGRSGEDLFLPRRIRARKVWASLRPYDPQRGIHLEWTQAEGRDLDIDLEHGRVNAGTMTLDLESNLAQARLKLRAEQGNYILERGVVSRLDLQAIRALAEKEERASASSVEREGNVSAFRTPDDTIPFVPRFVDIRQLRVELLPGEMESIAYRAAVAKFRNLRLDLPGQKIPKGRIAAYLDTTFLHGNLEANITTEKIHFNDLALTEVDIGKIRAWLEKRKSSETKSVKGGEPAAEKKTSEKGGIPFLPPVAEADRLLLSARPFKLGKLEANRSVILGKGIGVDLADAEIHRGALTADLDANLLRARLQGEVRDNRLLLDRNGNSELKLHRELFALLGLPLRAEAFSPVSLTGEADERGAEILAAFHAEKILTENNSSFNVDIHRSLTRLAIDFGEGNYTVTEEMNASTPQAPLSLAARLASQSGGGVRYRGRLRSPGLQTGNVRIDKLLGRPAIDFEGDLHSLLATLKAGQLSGRFESPDLKKGFLTLRTREPLRPARYVKLPAKLQEATMTAKAVLPVDFGHPLPLESNVTLRSNVANLEGVIGYDGNLSAKILARFPKNSLLKKWLPKLRLSALDPLKIMAHQQGKTWKLNLAGREIGAEADYREGDQQLKGEIRIAGSRIKIAGNPRERIQATLRTGSVRRMMKSLTRIYPLPDPKLDGDLSLDLTLDKLTQATLELRSKKFIPDSSARIKSPIEDIELRLSGDLKKRIVTVKKYGLRTGGMTIFSTKPGRIVMQKKRILLPEFWVNDSLKITGNYDLAKKEGDFLAKAPRFKIRHENANLDASVDIRGKVIGEKIDAKGKVTLLGGTVNYNLEAKHYATDEDIVILQHRKKNEEGFFRKNLQLTLYIESKKPLFFRQKEVNVELKPQLSIIKTFDADLQLLGSVSLAKGGYYIFQGKKFVLSPSGINFIGRPTQPLLDINLVYQRSGRTIYISVSGSATEPSLQFSSSPFMTRDQILSFILFDMVDSGENAEEMLGMVGGGIAKSILGNIGLKVDTLVVTSSGFEVGKKITDKITLLYDQRDREPRVIVRIRHSQHTETDISVGSESQSVDIIYRKEF